jgi:hypothetical protein
MLLFLVPYVATQGIIPDITSAVGDVTSFAGGVFDTVTSGAAGAFSTATSGAGGVFDTVTSGAVGAFGTATSGAVGAFGTVTSAAGAVTGINLLGLGFNCRDCDSAEWGGRSWWGSWEGGWVGSVGVGWVCRWTVLDLVRLYGGGGGGGWVLFRDLGIGIGKHQMRSYFTSLLFEIGGR